jgi:hypothetical protein
LKKKLGLTLASAKEERDRVYRRAGQPMKPSVHDASARQHSGEPSSGLGLNGGSKDRLRNLRLAELEFCDIADWSIGRQRTCGVPGGHYITLGRLLASVVI